MAEVVVVNPTKPVEIDLSVHLVSRENQRLERVDTVSLQSDLQSTAVHFVQVKALNHATMVESTEGLSGMGTS